MTASRRHLAVLPVALALALGGAPAAHAGSLLSGYGGPGASDQSLLGGLTPNGGSGGSGGSKGSGGSGSAAPAAPPSLRAPATAQTAAPTGIVGTSVAPQGGSVGGDDGTALSTRAPSSSPSSSNGTSSRPGRSSTRQGASTPAPPAPLAATPAAAQPAPSVQSVVPARTRAAGAGAPISAAEGFLVLVALLALAGLAALTARAGRPPRTVAT